MEREVVQDDGVFGGSREVTRRCLGPL